MRFDYDYIMHMHAIVLKSPDVQTCNRCIYYNKSQLQITIPYLDVGTAAG